LLEDAPLRPRALSARRGTADAALRPGGRRAPVLRDPRAHARYDPRARHAALHAHRSRGPLSPGRSPGRAFRAQGLDRRRHGPRAAGGDPGRGHAARRLPRVTVAALSFRLKLILAMMLTVAAATGAALLVT